MTTSTSVEPAAVADGETPPEPVAVARREVVRGVGLAASTFVASRVMVYLAMGVATVVHGNVPFRQAAAYWDGGWYLQIASSGYATGLPPHGVSQTTNLAFFPLFPAIVRGASSVTGLSPFRSALALNLVLGTVATMLVWLLARHLGDRGFADRAAALFAFFPATFVLSMPYSEAVMLVGAITCLYALVTRRWLMAGVAAAFATAARPNALALCLCCAFAAADAVWRRREWKALVAPALSPLGVIAFFAYLWHHTGDALIWSKAQSSGWGQGFDFGWAMVQAANRQLHHPGSDLNQVTAALSGIFVIVAIVLLARWKPPAVLTIYAVVVIALGYLSPALSSRPRFAMTAFPLAMAIAWRSRRTFGAVLGCSAVVLGAYTIISVSTLAITP